MISSTPKPFHRGLKYLRRALKLPVMVAGQMHVACNPAHLFHGGAKRNSRRQIE